jgi:hypothetical protein
MGDMRQAARHLSGKVNAQHFIRKKSAKARRFASGYLSGLFGLAFVGRPVGSVMF